MTSATGIVDRRGSSLPAVLIASSLAVMALGVLAGADPRALALLTIAVTGLALFHPVLSRWHVLVGIVVAVILFVPIKRYQLPGNLPFDLEFYRVTIAIVLALWLAALLVDARVSTQPTGLGGPLALFALAIFGSIVANAGRIQGLNVREVDLSSDVAKKTLFFASFYLVLLLVVSVIRDFRAIHAVLKTITAGSAILAGSALVEARTGYNAFNHLHSAVPFLQFEGALTEEGIARSGRLRIYASSGHPIELAAVLAMVLPLAIYLGRLTRRWWWWLSAGVIVLAVFATVSRTGIVMLATIAAVFLWLRRKEVTKLWPLVVPVLLAVHLVTPGVLGGLQGAFFPRGGLLQDQTVYGGRFSAQRLGGELDLIKSKPVFGQGFGTRITTGEKAQQNARVLDDEWLGTASETGIVGVIALAWLFVRFVRRLGREAKQDLSARGSLLVALAGSVAAFAVSMFTFDAFSFIQVTFLLFILLGLGMAVLATEDHWFFAERRLAANPTGLRNAPGEIS
ncbi:MAG: hypothetical protein HW413_1615 [Thermoleophilia bacterium]|nr:hypothetical protein [Thermoleophilia bacterium]